MTLQKSTIHLHLGFGIYRADLNGLLTNETVMSSERRSYQGFSLPYFRFFPDSVESDLEIHYL
jgi:hypothetical protein